MNGFWVLCLRPVARSFSGTLSAGNLFAAVLEVVDVFVTRPSTLLDPTPLHPRPWS